MQKVQLGTLLCVALLAVSCLCGTAAYAGSVMGAMPISGSAWSSEQHSEQSVEVWLKVTLAEDGEVVKAKLHHANPADAERYFIKLAQTAVHGMYVKPLRGENTAVVHIRVRTGITVEVAPPDME